MTISVFVVDYKVYSLGLASVLQTYPEFQLVGTADNGAEALAKIDELHPDIVIMDVFQPGCEGVEVITLLKQRCPQAKVLILTHSEKEDDFLKAIKAGADGYLLKSLEPAELVDSLRLVACGSAIVYTPMAAKIFDAPKKGNNQNKNGINGLSQREREVLQLIAQGASTKEIAAACFVSETTVKAHLRRILEKLGVKNRAQAVAIAAEKGLLNQKQT